MLGINILSDKLFLKKLLEYLMRILIVTGRYPPLKCGIGFYTRELSKSLSLTGKHVSVLSTFSSREPKNIQGVELLHGVKNWNFLSIFTVNKIIKKWKPDVIHVQFPTHAFFESISYSLIPILGFCLGKKIVMTWHESFSLSNFFKFFLLSVVPSKIIVVRPNYKNLLPFYKFLASHKTFNFIPNASTLPRVNLSITKKKLLKKKYILGKNRLIIYFGFIYPHKGVENILQIANPKTDQIIIAADLDPKNDYHRSLKYLIKSKWSDNISLINYMPENDLAALLNVADAIILPFRDGGGAWNTSIHAAVSSRSFLLTTSTDASGFNEDLNTYHSSIDNINEMRDALNKYSGTKNLIDTLPDSWAEISKKHIQAYDKN
jgi:glycosyltransferase involved in cell wall biosynthesis